MHNSKHLKFDLEQRTFNYSKEVIKFVKSILKDFVTLGILKQIFRSSTSIGANYIEANESLSKKDFLMRIKICRKESKETIYWLKLLHLNNSDKQNEYNTLIDEGTQLKKIFSAIIIKSQ